MGQALRVNHARVIAYYGFFCELRGMPQDRYSSTSPLNRAVGIAQSFERRGDACNALEWYVMALRYAPGDPLLTRRAADARAEMERQRREGRYSNPHLTSSDREALARHLRLAEGFLANGATRRALREVEAAARIDSSHPAVLRLQTTLEAAGGEAERKKMEARATLRLAVAASVPPARARSVLLDLRQEAIDKGCEHLLPRIDEAIAKLPPEDSSDD